MGKISRKWAKFRESGRNFAKVGEILRKWAKFRESGQNFAKVGEISRKWAKFWAFSGIFVKFINIFVSLHSCSPSTAA